MSKKAPKMEAPATPAADAAPTAPAVSAPKFVHDKKLAVNGDIKPEAGITWFITENPRAKGRATFDRFAKYFGAATVKEYTEKGGTRGDLLWDIRSGYLAVDNVTLGGDLKARAPKAPPKPKAEKVPKEPKGKKVVKEVSEEQKALEASVKEEVVD